MRVKSFLMNSDFLHKVRDGSIGRILPGPTFPFMLFIFLLIFYACGSPAAQTVQITAGGSKLNVEIADTAETREKGLMNRKSLPDDCGMLFVFEQERKVSFWMKNTSIPLSIAFISSGGRILQIEDMEPFSLDSVQSARSVKYALEVNQGWFEQHNVQPGDNVEIPQEVLKSSRR